MFGLLNVNKPPGPTSHDIVAQIRRKLPQRTKVGHAGTLDPFAGGVLVLCIGPATRLADYIQRQTKRYLAEITLGATSSTDDIQGQITPTGDGNAPPPESLERVTAAMIGRIEQAPPAHSAVHINGRRAYQLARSGQVVKPAPRPVTIHSIDVIDYCYPRLVLDVRCGSGTYIRAIARDIGAALGVGGYCSALTRTAIGQFTTDTAVDVDAIDPQSDLLGPLLALGDMPGIVLSAGQAAEFANGRAIPAADVSADLTEANEVAALDERGRLLAIAVVDSAGGTIRPSKVFPKTD